MPKSNSKLIQITDCHLGEEAGTKLLSMDPDESLYDVLHLINHTHPESDLLIVTGDLANKPSLKSYQRLYMLLSKHINCPFIWLPGNHDDPKIMSLMGETVNTKLHVLGNWLIILLDSHVDDALHGHLGHEELQFLQHTLAENSNKYAVVCLHHQPVLVGSQWIDNHIVKNATDFWALISLFSQVKIVLWGHIHQEFSSQEHRVALFSTPSTCIQFAPKTKNFQLDNTMMPGYRWFDLDPHGLFTTGITRVAEKIRY